MEHSERGEARAARLVRTVVHPRRAEDPTGGELGDRREQLWASSERGSRRAGRRIHCRRGGDGDRHLQREVERGGQREHRAHAVITAHQRAVRGGRPSGRDAKRQVALAVKARGEAVQARRVELEAVAPFLTGE